MILDQSMLKNNEKKTFLSDVPEAYVHLSRKDLHHTWLFFVFLSKPWVRKYVLFYLSPSWGKLPFISTYIKRRLFTYFCGGETIAACTTPIMRLYKHGIYSVLDYAVEAACNEDAFIAHAAEIAEMLRATKQHKAIAFTALKPSALGNTQVMAKKVAKLPLTNPEKEALNAFSQRLQMLAESAYRLHVPLLIDAEESAFQAYVDEEVMRLSAIYNKKWVCLYNTFQLYRKDGYTQLTRMHTHARKTGFLLGVKLVRGAYMDKEAKKALATGRPNPILPNKEACDTAYNKAIHYVLDNIDSCALFAGTHNEESCLLLYEALRTRELTPGHTRIFLSQLYGMSDNLSYGLAHMGMQVAKYIPYGRYEQLLPYLHRRALENSSLQGQSSREQQAIQRELKQRAQKL